MWQFPQSSPGSLMKMCLLIKPVGRTHRALGSTAVMISVGRGTELQNNEDRLSFSVLFSTSGLPVIFQPHFQLPPSICVCVCECVWGGGIEFDAQTVWFHFYGPLSSIRHTGMLSASARLNLLQCFITCECVCVCSHPSNNASLHVPLRDPLACLTVSLPSESPVNCPSHIY